MDGLQRLPFVLIFRTDEGECRINFPLPCTDRAIIEMPILSGKLSQAWHKNRKVTRIFVSLLELQDLYGYSVSIGEAKLALRLLQNFIVYGPEVEKLGIGNHSALVQICSVYKVDFLNVYRVLHYLCDGASVLVFDAILIDIQAQCPVSCFGTSKKVGHHKLLKWLRLFLRNYFGIGVVWSDLSESVVNRINVWPLLVEVCWTELLYDIFHLDTLSRSDKCSNMLEEMFQVRTRQDAIDLEHSFWKRCR